MCHNLTTSSPAFGPGAWSYTAWTFTVCRTRWQHKGYPNCESILRLCSWGVGKITRASLGQPYKDARSLQARCPTIKNTGNSRISPFVIGLRITWAVTSFTSISPTWHKRSIKVRRSKP